MTFSIPIPDDDVKRVEALDQYLIMNTEPEISFDEITELAAELLGCPVSYIEFMNEDKQFFKSKYGLSDEYIETPRDMAICAHTICQNDLLLVPDLTKDDRFSEHPIVTGAPNIVFYAGMPFITPSGHAIGTICAVDFETREISLNLQESLRRLSNQVVSQLELRRLLIETKKVMAGQDEINAQLTLEKYRSDQLLLNILPTKVSEELKDNGTVEPKFFSSASVMFADFSGFTKLSETMDPKSLIELLNKYFSAFDSITMNHKVEKIKTIGDAYMCVSGLPEESRGHAIRMCLVALEIQQYLGRANTQREKLRMPPWDMRIGIHSGPVIAGVVGERKFTYDVWGDSVNIAAVMEQYCEPGKVNISGTTYQNVSEVFEIEKRGAVESTKKGNLEMFFLNRLKPEFSADQFGLKTNDLFEKTFGSRMKIYQ